MTDTKTMYRKIAEVFEDDFPELEYEDMMYIIDDEYEAMLDRIFEKLKKVNK